MSTSADTEIGTGDNCVNGLQNLLSRFGFSEIEIQSIMTDCGLPTDKQHADISLEQVRSNTALAKILERLVQQFAEELEERKDLRHDSEEMPSMQLRPFSMEEVSYHNRAEDLWVVIEGTVYDLTDFAKRHPGGVDVLALLSGGDATQAWQHQHGNSESVRVLMRALCIGEVAMSQDMSSASLS